VICTVATDCRLQTAAPGKLFPAQTLNKEGVNTGQLSSGEEKLA